MDWNELFNDNDGNYLRVVILNPPEENIILFWLLIERSPNKQILVLNFSLSALNNKIADSEYVRYKSKQRTFTFLTM